MTDTPGTDATTTTTEGWLTPGVAGIGAASLLADVGHEVPTAPVFSCPADHGGGIAMVFNSATTVTLQLKGCGWISSPSAQTGCPRCQSRGARARSA